MRKFFPVDSLARDSRFSQITMAQSQADPRSAMLGPETQKRSRTSRLTPSRPDASEAARSLMHGIFVVTTSRPAPRRRSRSSSTWPARPGTKPATWRSA
jgi:hypothetical protein